MHRASPSHPSAMPSTRRPRRPRQFPRTPGEMALRSNRWDRLAWDTLDRLRMRFLSARAHDHYPTPRGRHAFKNAGGTAGGQPTGPTCAIPPIIGSCVGPARAHSINPIRTRGTSIGTNPSGSFAERLKGPSQLGLAYTASHHSSIAATHEITVPFQSGTKTSSST